MDKIDKEWNEKGRAALHMKDENLSSLAAKLEKMASLKNLGGFLTEESSKLDQKPVRIFMPTLSAKDANDKISIVRDLLLLASFRPGITRIIALREDKKAPKNHIELQDFQEILAEKGIRWDSGR